MGVRHHRNAIVKPGKLVRTSIVSLGSTSSVMVLPVRVCESEYKRELHELRAPNGKKRFAGRQQRQLAELQQSAAHTGHKRWLMQTNLDEDLHGAFARAS